jgi:hypothetical protein
MVVRGEYHGLGGGIEPDRLAAHEADIDPVQERQHIDSEGLGPRLVQSWPNFEHWFRGYQCNCRPGTCDTARRDRGPEPGKAAADDENLVRHTSLLSAAFRCGQPIRGGDADRGRIWIHDNLNLLFVT